MAQKLYEESNIQSIADAIRAKNGSTDTYKTSEMAAAISAISTGGGGIPEEALTLVGNATYRFAYNNWNWFLQTYTDQIDMTGLSATLTSAFLGCSNLRNIPFSIVLNENRLSVYQMLYQCTNAVTIPTISGGFTATPVASGGVDISTALQGCHCLRDAENFLSECDLSELTNIKITSSYSCPKYGSTIAECYSLRQVPSWWYKLLFSEESTAYPTYTNSLYYQAFKNNYSLDEIENIPVLRCAGAQTSNMFSNSFSNTSRAKSITFETQEGGSPYVVKWKSQTIELTSVGFAVNGNSYILIYNSGIKADKQVTDDTTYQALKDDPDWFTTNVAYSRYNHDSAVATINSLPDTSAYLASAGGTNTIKFKGAAGSSTDGGAINTLTEEEIAVATAKGWTVTLS